MAGGFQEGDGRFKLPESITKNRVLYPLWILASLALVVALKGGRMLLIPLTLSVLISLLLSPLVRVMERPLRSRVAAVLAIVLSVLLLGGWGTWTASRQIADLANHLPEYSERLQHKLAQIRAPVGGLLEKGYGVVQKLQEDVLPASRPPAGIAPVQVEVIRPPTAPVDLLSAALGSMMNTMGSLVVIVVLVIFLLIYQADLRDRVIHLTGPSMVNITTRTLDQAGEAVGRYLLLQTTVNAVYGVLVSGVLVLLGVPNALLWGLLAGVLRFIPYVGVWIGLVCPTLIALAEFDGWSRPIALISVIFCLETAIGNALEPWLYGHRTGLSPPAVILSALFWAWLWGPEGLLLSVPLTTCLATLGRQIPSLRFVNTLLGDAPPLQPAVRLYQRLLSRDPHKAMDFVDAFLKEGTMMDLYDALLIPVLRLSRQNHAAGELEDLQYHRVLDMTAELLEVNRESSEIPATPGENGALPVHVLFVSAEPGADDLCTSMLAHLLGPAEARRTLIRGDLLTAEKMDQIHRASPDILFISALSPSVSLALRHLLKRLRGQVQGIPVVLGLWGDTTFAERAINLPGCAVSPVQTMKEAHQVLMEEIARAAMVKPVESPPEGR